MPFPIIPVAGVALLGAAAVRQYRKRDKMTPESKRVFEQAMKTLKDPAKLRTLAAAFDKEGLKPQGDELRKRAAIFAAPPKVQEQRRQVFKKAMNSNNPVAVKKVAAAFQKVGHYEGAQKLRNYARGLFKVSPKVQAKATVHGDESCNDATTPEV